MFYVVFCITCSVVNNRLKCLNELNTCTSVGEENTDFSTIDFKQLLFLVLRITCGDLKLFRAVALSSVI